MKIKGYRVDVNKDDTSLASRREFESVNIGSKNIAHGTILTRRELRKLKPTETQKTLIKIADYFDISLDNLCERPRPYDLPTAATQEQRQAVNLIMQLDATNTLRVISYCAGLLTNQN